MKKEYTTYPYAASFENPGDGKNTECYTYGLTKREYFAGRFLQGILSNSSSGKIMNFSDMAKTSVQLADALIDELNKQSA